jgi:hypothetical protein
MSVKLRGAKVFPIPPPAFYGAALGIGMLLQRAYPLHLDPGTLRQRSSRLPGSA